MSWDKQTINLSSLDAIKDTLDDLGVSYDLSVIAEFKGRGLNDPDGEVYQLRRLQYDGKVVLEYAELDADCDADDRIMSYTINLDEEPEDWHPIRYTDIFGEDLDEVGGTEPLWDDNHVFEQEYFS